MRNCDFAGAFLALLLMAAGGCQPTPPPSRYYSGPTDPMWKVVADINQNNAKVPTLYALLGYRATLVDKQHGNRTKTISGDGSLLFRRPHSLLLRGTKDLVGEVFAIG